MIARAERFIAERGRPDPFGHVRPGFEPLPAAERRRLAGALAPHIRGLCSTDRRVVGRLDRQRPRARLRWPARPSSRLAPLGTSCPDHFIRTKVRPLLLDLPPTAPVDDLVARLRELHAAYRDDYAAYYRRHADARLAADAGRRPGDRARAGRRACSASAPTPGPPASRASSTSTRINVMRGAEALSTYAPIDEAEKFRIEYWALEEAKLRRLPPPQAAGRPGRARDRGGVGHRPGHRRPPGGRGRGGRASPTATSRAPRPWPPSWAAPTWRRRSRSTSPTRPRSPARSDGRVPRLRRRRPGGQQRGAVDLEAAGRDDRRRLGPAARRHGPGLVPRQPGGGPGDGGARGCRPTSSTSCRRTRVVAGQDNVAYGAAKADQAHQVRLLATELGPLGVRVNGVNPDGVVRGLGHLRRRAGARSGPRCTACRREELGQFYAGRTAARPRGAARARRRRGVRAVLGRAGAHDGHDRAGGRRGADGVPTVRAMRSRR